VPAGRIWLAGSAPPSPGDIQRKLLTPGGFEDLDTLTAQILAFEQHFNATATPFG
jgi:hypothetical protein